ncbi:MAG: hypothetical protein Fur0042_21920 [Cyanophyceae cyanobacterium]
MDPVALPSHIHYEIILQVLERETTATIPPGSPEQRSLQELTATLRRAFALQKHLEAACQEQHLPIDYRWTVTPRGGQTPEPEGPGAIAAPEPESVG